MVEKKMEDKPDWKPPTMAAENTTQNAAGQQKQPEHPSKEDLITSPKKESSTTYQANQQVTPADRERLTEKQKILKEFGGLESNIPITHPYWTMSNT